MVNFNKKGFTVNVASNLPASSYVQTMHDIIDIIQAQDPEMERNNYHLLQLLQAMLPTEEQAKAIVYGTIKCN